MITLITPDEQYITLSNGLVWTFVGIVIAVVVALYLLRSFGIYVLAKKRGLDKAFLAFIPCVWIFTACKLIGNVRVFGSTFEKVALLFCIVFSVGEVLNFIYNFMIYFPVAGNFLMGKQFYLIMVADPTRLQAYTDNLTHITSTLYGSNLTNPYTNLGIAPQTIKVLSSVISLVSTLTDIATIVITITLYINLFRKYIPNHYVLFTVLSFFGIFAPLVFAIRNKPAGNYTDYLRARYNTWQANGNPYGGPVNNGAPYTPPSPFEEFAEKGEVDPGDPFEDFSDKKSNDKDEFFN